MKLKEIEKWDGYQDLAGELKIKKQLWNMKVMETPIVISELGTVSEILCCDADQWKTQEEHKRVDRKTYISK